MKGHQALERRAALQPSEEILEESAKERMQVRMCGNNALLSVLSTSPPALPPPMALFSPQPQPRTLLRRNRVVRRKGPSEGTGSRRHCTPEGTTVRAFCSSDWPSECRTDTGTRTSGQTHASAAQLLPCVDTVCSW